APTKLPRTLDRHNVLGLLDDADHRVVAPRIGTDPALLFLGDVSAGDAEPYLVLHLGEYVGEPAYVHRIGVEYVERDPLRALRADAGQPAEFVDQILNDAFVHRAKLAARSPPDRRAAARSHRPFRRRVVRGVRR